MNKYRTRREVKEFQEVGFEIVQLGYIIAICYLLYCISFVKLFTCTVVNLFSTKLCRDKWRIFEKLRKIRSIIIFQLQSNDSAWENSYQLYAFQIGLQGVSSISAAIDEPIREQLQKIAFYKQQFLRQLNSIVSDLLLTKLLGQDCQTLQEYEEASGCHR